MTSINLHIYAEQMTGFGVWMENHGPQFREDKKNFYQLCGALYHNLERLKGNSKFPNLHPDFQ